MIAPLKESIENLTDRVFPYGESLEPHKDRLNPFGKIETTTPVATPSGPSVPKQVDVDINVQASPVAPQVVAQATPRAPTIVGLGAVPQSPTVSVLATPAAPSVTVTASPVSPTLSAESSPKTISSINVGATPASPAVVVEAEPKQPALVDLETDIFSPASVSIANTPKKPATLDAGAYEFNDPYLGLWNYNHTASPSDYVVVLNPLGYADSSNVHNYPNGYELEILKVQRMMSSTHGGVLDLIETDDGIIGGVENVQTFSTSDRGVEWQWVDLAIAPTAEAYSLYRGQGRPPNSPAFVGFDGSPQAVSSVLINTEPANPAIISAGVLPDAVTSVTLESSPAKPSISVDSTPSSPSVSVTSSPLSPTLISSGVVPQAPTISVLSSPVAPTTIIVQSEPSAVSSVSAVALTIPDAPSLIAAGKLPEAPAQVSLGSLPQAPSVVNISSGQILAPGGLQVQATPKKVAQISAGNVPESPTVDVEATPIAPTQVANSSSPLKPTVSVESSPLKPEISVESSPLASTNVVLASTPKTPRTLTQDSNFCLLGSCGLTPNDGTAYNFPEADKPLVVALQNDGFLVEGEYYRIRRVNTITGGAAIENLSGIWQGWSNGRGVTWEVVTDGSITVEASPKAPSSINNSSNPLAPSLVSNLSQPLVPGSVTLARSPIEPASTTLVSSPKAPATIVGLVDTIESPSDVVAGPDTNVKPDVVATVTLVSSPISPAQTTVAKSADSPASVTVAKSADSPASVTVAKNPEAPTTPVVTHSPAAPGSVSAVRENIPVMPVVSYGGTTISDNNTWSNLDVEPGSVIKFTNPLNSEPNTATRYFYRFSNDGGMSLPDSSILTLTSGSLNEITVPADWGITGRATLFIYFLDDNGTSINDSLTIGPNLEGRARVNFKLLDAAPDAPASTTVLSSPVTPASVVATDETPVPVSYSLSHAPTQVVEGNDVIVTLTTTGVAQGTEVGYIIQGAIDDFGLPAGFPDGTFTVGADGTDTVTLSPIEDHVVEGVGGVEQCALALVNSTQSGTEWSSVNTVIEVTDSVAQFVIMRVLPQIFYPPYDWAGRMTSMYMYPSLGNFPPPFLVEGNTSYYALATDGTQYTVAYPYSELRRGSVQSGWQFAVSQHVSLEPLLIPQGSGYTVNVDNSRTQSFSLGNFVGDTWTQAQIDSYTSWTQFDGGAMWSAQTYYQETG